MRQESHRLAILEVDIESRCSRSQNVRAFGTPIASIGVVASSTIDNMTIIKPYLTAVFL